jgi:DNA-binding HxlR family transcriptional regulator
MDRDLLETLKAFADVTRLRVIGALAAGPGTVGQLAAASGLSPAVVHKQLGLLEAVGLVERPAGRDDAGSVHALRVGEVHELGRRLAALQAEADPPAAADPTTGPDGEALPPEDAKILRSFFEGGRLVSIPAQDRKRIVVIRYLRDRCFGEDRAYPEKEVNQRLALFHPDVASLRRHLVDAGLMTRAAGEYRRA